MLTGFSPHEKGTTLTDCREMRDTKNMKVKKKKKGKELPTAPLPKAKRSSCSLLSLSMQAWLPDGSQHRTGSWPPSSTPFDRV